MISSAPTRVRYGVIAVTALAAVLLYLHRNCIAFLAVYLRENLGISDEGMSWVFSAFYLSYALAQVPSGWLSDRFGPRRMLTMYILAWSLFTAATGLATGLVMLLALRLLVGLAQAGAYPTAAGLVGRWTPLPERGKANGIVALGGRVGGVIASIVTALLLVAYTPLSTSSRFLESDLLNGPRLEQQLQSRNLLPPETPETPEALLAELNHLLEEPNLPGKLDPQGLSLSDEAKRLLKLSPEQRSPAETERLNRLLIEAACPGSLRQLYGRTWREVLWTYGGIGLVVALLFWWIVRDRPGDHPWANAAEVELAGTANPAAPRAAGIPWLLLIRSQNMWLSGLSQFGINFGWVFLVTLLPSFLTEVYQVPIEERGTMAGIPLAVSCIGMFLGGVLTDRLVKILGLRWGRALPVGATQIPVCLHVSDLPLAAHRLVGNFRPVGHGDSGGPECAVDLGLLPGRGRPQRGHDGWLGEHVGQPGRGRVAGGGASHPGPGWLVHGIRLLCGRVRDRRRGGVASQCDDTAGPRPPMSW